MRALLILCLIMICGTAAALGRGQVMMESLTSAEIAALVKGGKTTAIIATGGIEQNGPYVVTGKHNLIVRTTAQEIAHRLGNALVAPVVPVVVNGTFDPPSGHMQYPGTLSLRPETFINLVVDMAASLKVQGFTDLILIGDSGDNEEHLKAAAKALDEQWSGAGMSVRYIPEYYAAWNGANSVAGLLQDSGIQESADGHHHSVVIAATLLAIDPQSVRFPVVINGVRIEPISRFQMLGRFMIQDVVARTVKAIRQVN